MKKLAIIVALLAATQNLCAQSNGGCNIKMSAANIQDGGIIIGVNYTVSLPSLNPPTPFVSGEPDDCAFSVSPTGIPDARSYIQSDFQGGFSGATSASLRRTIRIKSVDLIPISDDPKLTFSALRFYDRSSLDTNKTQELLLVAKPGANGAHVNIGGIWRTNNTNGTFSDRVAFTEMNFILPSVSSAEFHVVWLSKTSHGIATSEIFVFRDDNGFYQSIYSATDSIYEISSRAHAPIVFPFSSTVGALSDSGLQKRTRGLAFITSFSCSQNTVAISCF